MEDLAGLRVAPVVALRRLKGGELFQRAAGEGRVDADGLVADDQTIAPEERHEPGHPRGGNPLGLRYVGHLDAQRRHVLGSLAIDTARRAATRLQMGGVGVPRREAVLAAVAGAGWRPLALAHVEEHDRL